MHGPSRAGGPFRASHGRAPGAGLWHGRAAWARIPASASCRQTCRQAQKSPAGRHFCRPAGLFPGGRYWVRTSDLSGVNGTRYHCANRPISMSAPCLLRVMSIAAFNTVAHAFPFLIIGLRAAVHSPLHSRTRHGGARRCAWQRCPNVTSAIVDKRCPTGSIALKQSTWDRHGSADDGPMTCGNSSIQAMDPLLPRPCHGPIWCFGKSSGNVFTAATRTTEAETQTGEMMRMRL